MFSDPQPERLGNLCYIKARIGWRGLSAAEYTDNGPFLIAGQHIKNGLILWDSCDHITEQRYLESHEIILRRGDVIITKDGTIGRVARIDELPGKATINGTMMLVRPLRCLDYRYLYHVLNGRSFQKLIEDKISGSSIPHLFQRDMVELKVDLPPAKHQSKIAEILDTLDIGIRETEAVVAKLEAMKRGLLHDLLTRGIDKQGNLRPPQPEAPHLYKQTRLGWLPKEWGVLEIQDMLAAVEPAMRSGPFGSALLKEELVNRGIPFLGIDNVYVERFDRDYKRFVTPSKFHQLRRYSVRPDDLMITIMGTVGRCCLVPKDIGEALSSKHTWTISLDQEKYSPYLAMLQINYSDWVLRHFSKDQQGGTMSAIRSETIKSTRLPVPHRDEQSLIETILGEISTRLLREKALLEKYHLQKSGLMHDLLIGQVSVAQLL